ncbi:MAG TPA: hypothetical protein EYG57_11130 [Planctomycetes bacterium]|nr:hypothetical protein [Verrucomicrobiales bacterium]HIM30104.1 hypothetical protein [Planctomycetota bacterium]
MNDEDAARMHGPQPDGDDGFAAQWNDGGLSWTLGYVIEYSGEASLIADTLSARKTAFVHPSALTFTPPKRSGRSERIGILVPSVDEFESRGSEWEFDYRWNDRGVQLIHPFKNGQCIITIERDSISLTTPIRWVETGHEGYDQGNTGNLSYTAGYDDVFPLDDYSRHHVQTTVETSGRVLVSVDYVIVADGEVTEAFPIDFSVSETTDAEKMFSGDGFPLQWSRGFAGVIVEPVGGAFNGLTRLTYFPGLPDPPVIVVEPTNVAAIEGQTANFAVEVTGASPFEYQWFFAGENLAQAVDSMLALENVTVGQSGEYSVLVGNASFGTALSRAATLSVTPPRASKQMLRHGPMAATTVPSRLVTGFKWAV